MSRIKDMLFDIEEMILEGLDEVEIARELDLPIDMVQEVYDQFTEYDTHSGWRVTS